MEVKVVKEESSTETRYFIWIPNDARMPEGAEKSLVPTNSIYGYRGYLIVTQPHP